jgi:hypothetical protein
MSTVNEFGGDAIEDLPEGLDFGDAVGDEEELETEVEEVEEVEEIEEVEEAADEEEKEQDSTDEDEDGEEAAPKAKGKEPFVPKSRMDSALRKARAAEQRADDFQAQLAEMANANAKAAAPKPLTNEQIRGRMALANEALLAGDSEKAAELQAELMESLAARPEAAKQAAPERDVVAEVEERMEFKQVLKDTYSRFPQLDENNESFDEDLAQEAVDLQMAYMKRGHTMSEATKKAAEAVAKIHDLEDTRALDKEEEEDKEPAARVAAKTKQGAKTKEKLAKAVKAAPPLVGSRGDEGDVAFDIFSATEEEFMALPKSVQDRLLGNTI